MNGILVVERMESHTHRTSHGDHILSGGALLHPYFEMVIYVPKEFIRGLFFEWLSMSLKVWWESPAR